MYKVGLIVENAKELSDYIFILNKLNAIFSLEVKLVFLADIYRDKKQNELLENITFKYTTLKIDNIYNKRFKEYNFFEKIWLTKKNMNFMYDFIKECDLLLSGVQTIFERVLFSQINKNNLHIKTIVYHRHLLFDDTVNTGSSKILHNRVVFKLFSIFNLDGFLIEKKAIGYANKYMVLGEINKLYLMDKGISEDKIFVVGSLEYDNIQHLIMENNFNIKNPKICYITSACEWIGDIEGEKYQKEKIDNFLKYCQKENIKKITIRVHPREDEEKYEALKKKYNFVELQYGSNNQLLDDLNKFDVIIGGFSTVLFEAMLINKKIIFYTLEKERYRYKSLIENFILPYITDIEKLQDVLLDKTKTDGSVFIKYNKDEKSIDRIINFLKKELNE